MSEMNAANDLSGPARDLDPLERRLRAGATAFAPAPPAALRGRILSQLRASPRLAPPVLVRSERYGTALAAAAAVLVLLGAWGLTRGLDRPAPRARSVAELARNLFDAGSRVRALPSQAEGNLRLEAEKLLDDTTRAARGVVRGLPAPLRERLERM